MVTLREYLVYLEQNLELALAGVEPEVAEEIRADLERAKNLPAYMLEEQASLWISQLPTQS